MEQPEKLLSADEVKATLSPHMKSVWDAAAKCLDASTEENLAEFKKLCRPAEIIVLMRYYAESVVSETNVEEHAPLSAGAGVGHGVEVETTEEHENSCRDSTCSLLHLITREFGFFRGTRSVGKGIKSSVDQVRLLRVISEWIERQPLESGEHRQDKSAP